MKNENFKRFHEQHINEMQYSFQFKSCDNSECNLCGKPSKKQVHEDFCWLPAPEISNNDPNKYKGFVDAITKEKSFEKCRPGAKATF
jgi:hypothetical protein